MEHNFYWLDACRREKRIDCLRQHLDTRRQILFAAACCRLVWEVLTELGRKAVEAAEGYVDGIVNAEELRRKHQAATMEARKSETWSAECLRWAIFAATNAANAAYAPRPTANAAYAPKAAANAAAMLAPFSDVGRYGRQWLRQNTVFNSFLPFPVTQAWRNRNTEAIACAVYQGESGDFSILLDALEDTGADTFRHRNINFYKGNWLVDWLRGMV